MDCDCVKDVDKNHLLKGLKMKRFGKGIMAFVLLTGLVAMFGCSLVQDAIMPNVIEREAIVYSGQKATSWVPWTTVLDGERILEWVEFNHIQYQTACDRMKEDDKLLHGKIVDRQTRHNQQAVEFKNKIFSPNGVVGMAFPALFAGTFGAMFINTPKKKRTA